jgi:hypothetical protein
LLVRTTRNSRFSGIHITFTECFFTKENNPRIIKEQDVTVPLLGSRDAHIPAGLQASKKYFHGAHYSH